MNPTLIGISEVQKAVIELIAQGLSDKEIAQKLGVANSTIRNHRYKLREKEKQAKLFLTMIRSGKDTKTRLFILSEVR